MEAYNQALLFRDNKVEGVSLENSVKEAERIFLELSATGHVKAMHNYASLQFKQGKYDIAYQYFKMAGLEASKANCQKMVDLGQVSHLLAFGVKETICLVVGSNRQKKPVPSYLLDQIYGKQVDLSHTKSFIGQAVITVDNSGSADSKGRHIVADAASYDFNSLYSLKHVLLERLPTCGEDKDRSAIQNQSDNVVGRCIINLAKAMPTGAILEIEWDPYVAFGNVNDDLIEHFAEINPFNGVVNKEVLFAAAKEMIGAELRSQLKEKEVNGTSEFLIKVKEMAEFLRNEIEYYHAVGAADSAHQLMLKVYFEVFIQSYMEEIGVNTIFIEYNLLLDSPATFLNAVSGVQYRELPVERNGTMIRLQYDDGTHRDGFVCTLRSFAQEAFYNFLCSSLTVQKNTPLVKKYLENLGFGDVIVERRTNAHNGRRHVWMVTATKL